MKCDEQRPKCHRCVSTGRACAGFVGQPQPISTIKIYSLPYKVPGSRADRELVNFYHCHVAESISKLSDTTMWLELIMQQSQYYPVIRNTLVTLSSLYKDFVLVDSTSMATCKNIGLITKAHKQLRAHLLSRNASVEVTLICSLLFHILECLVGNTQQALWHLDRGLTLLQHYHDEPPSSMNIPNFDRILAVFSRLDVLASLFDDERRPILKFDLAKECAKSFGFLSSGSGSPDDLLEAERLLIILQNSVMHNLISFAHHKHNTQDEIPLWIIEESYNLEQKFQQLEIGLEALSLRKAEGPKHNQKQQRITLLQIEASVFHSALLEVLSTSLGTTDMSTEADRRFALAISQIRTLIATNNEPGIIRQARAFTLSTNLTAILYYICMKARNREIVESALLIMQTDLCFTRDGLWDTTIAADVVQSLVFQYNDRGAQSQSQEIKLEDVGSGIVDTSGGLEEAFRQLKLAESPKTNGASLEV